VKLPKSTSLVHILAEEEAIYSFHKALNQININYNLNSNERIVSIADIVELLKIYDNLLIIANADLNIITKLFLISKNEQTTFDKIKRRFCDIFPQVENIKIELIKDSYDAQNKLLYNTSINIKEKNIPYWIEESNISSGMWQSLMLISELYLSPEGGIFLIDEFENSLGINCLDELVSDILRSKRNLQFILTSHHPYIINNINFNHWKVVTRNGGVVKTHNAAHFHLGKSKHTAFMQLIQLEAYQTGSETAL
jgi:predicted ATPase